MNPDFINSLNRYSRSFEQKIVDLANCFYLDEESPQVLSSIENGISLMKRFLFSALRDYPDFSFEDKTSFLDCFDILYTLENDLDNALKRSDVYLLISCLSRATTLRNLFEDQRAKNDK
jgi:hypothetical protein